MNRKKIILLVLLLLLIACGFLYWYLTSSPPPVLDQTPPPENRGEPSPPGDIPKVESPEEKARRLLVGVWQDNYEGKRTMTLKADGTGTMLVELSGLKATLYASKLRFDMKWSLNGDKLTKTTVSGEPERQVNLILNLMGNTAVDTILELNETRLLLLDKDNKTKYNWQRVKTE